MPLSSHVKEVFSSIPAAAPPYTHTPGNQSTLLITEFGEEMGTHSAFGKYKEPPPPRYTEYSPNGSRTFFEMCNCVKLVWFQIYTEMWAHLVFIQTNSS